MICTGAIVQFKIARAVINDTLTLAGNEDFLRSRGVEVIDAAHTASIRQMRDCIAANPSVWNKGMME